jgi:hypothetical protein
MAAIGNAIRVRGNVAEDVVMLGKLALGPAGARLFAAKTRFTTVLAMPWHDRHCKPPLGGVAIQSRAASARRVRSGLLRHAAQ